ncbi:MAG: LamG-like jellyroll fold domain-containing protein [Pirellulales bacterium]
MAKGIDVYYEWLGIKPEDQPPNHYQLLGVDLFESDEHILSRAADERMVFVRTFATGQHSNQSQSLLNEIAAATHCLVDDSRRAEYNKTLNTPAEPPPVVGVGNRPNTAFRADPVEPRREAALVEPVDAKKMSKPVLLGAIGGGVALILAIVIAIIVLSGEKSDVADVNTVLDGTPGESFEVVDVEDVAFDLRELRAVIKDGGCLIKGTVDGVSPDKATYTLIAEVKQPELTGFRIDEIAGRSENGMFAISEIEAYAVPDNTAYLASHRQAVATVTDRAADEMLDRNLGTFWSPSKPGAAALTFAFAEPVKRADVAPGNSSFWLHIVIHQRSGGRQTIGKFRFAVRTGGKTSGARPAENNFLSPTLAHWRFEDDLMDEPIPVNNGLPATVDSSPNQNQLYAHHEGSVPTFSKDTSAATLRGSGAENKQSLDVTADPVDGQTARYLKTAPSYVRPARDVGCVQLEKWTVEAAFKLNDLTGRHVLLCKSGQPPQVPEAAFELAVDAAGKKIQITAIDQTGAKRTASSLGELSLVAGGWYHVAAICDGENLLLLVDAPGDGRGYLQQQSVPFEGSLIDSFGQWWIGCGCSVGEPAGSSAALIDEIRISGAALPEADLLFHGTAEQYAQEKAAAPPTVATTDGGPKAPNPTEPPDPGTPQPTPPVSNAEIKFHLVKVDKDPVAGEGDSETKINKPDDAGWMVVSGVNPDEIIYHVEAETDQSQITGFRLEVLSDGKKGGGRGDSGKFILTDFNVEVADEAGENWDAVNFVKKKHGLPDDKTGSVFGAKWTVTDTRSHWAVFVAEKPVGFKGKTQLKIHLHQADGGKATIGKFRLAIMTGANAESGEAPGDQMLAEIVKSDPFARMDAMIELPLINPDEPLDGDKLAPTPLGYVYMTPDGVFEPELIGVEKGHGAPGVFSLIDGQPGGEEGQQNWDIQFRTVADNPPVTVGRLFRIGEGVAFQWRKAAGNIPDANFLRNCAMNFRMGAAMKTVVLRRSLDCQSMVFELADLKKRVEPFHVNIPYAPSSGEIYIQLQLSGADEDNPKPLPQHKFVPKSTIAVKRGEASVLFGENGYLRVKLITNWNGKDKGFELVRQRPAWQTPKMPKAVPFNRQAVDKTNRLRIEAESLTSKAITLAGKFEGEDVDPPESEEEKAKLKNAKAFLTRVFGTADTSAVEDSEKYKKLIQELALFKELLSAADDFDEKLAARLEMRIYSSVEIPEAKQAREELAGIKRESLVATKKLEFARKKLTSAEAPFRKAEAELENRQKADPVDEDAVAEQQAIVDAERKKIEPELTEFDRASSSFEGVRARVEEKNSQIDGYTTEIELMRSAGWKD